MTPLCARKASLLERYGPCWAVVTGATGGVGKSVCRRLVAQGVGVIAVSRSERALEALGEQLLAELKGEGRRGDGRGRGEGNADGRAPGDARDTRGACDACATRDSRPLLSANEDGLDDRQGKPTTRPDPGRFNYLYLAVDLSADTRSFPAAFGAFCAEKGVDWRDIRLLYHIAGYGEFTRFEQSSLDHKLGMLNCNFVSVVCLTHYFYGLFCRRYDELAQALSSGGSVRAVPDFRSGIAFVSSCLALYPGPYFALYHSTKRATTAFASSLAIEAPSKRVDILCVHPSTIRDSKFFSREEMHADQLPPSRKAARTSFLAVTSDTVAEALLTQLGRRLHVHVGLTAKACVLLDHLLPSSVLCWIVRHSGQAKALAE